ncbi:hypothetical protein ACUH9Y_01375 [Dermabacteraceae bacterium P13115]
MLAAISYLIITTVGLFIFLLIYLFLAEVFKKCARIKREGQKKESGFQGRLEELVIGVPMSLIWTALLTAFFFVTALALYALSEAPINGAPKEGIRNLITHLKDHPQNIFISAFALYGGYITLQRWKSQEKSVNNNAEALELNRRNAEESNQQTQKQFEASERNFRASQEDSMRVHLREEFLSINKLLSSEDINTRSNAILLMASLADEYENHRRKYAENSGSSDSEKYAYSRAQACITVLCNIVVRRSKSPTNDNRANRTRSTKKKNPGVESWDGNGADADSEVLSKIALDQIRTRLQKNVTPGTESWQGYTFQFFPLEKDIPCLIDLSDLYLSTSKPGEGSKQERTAIHIRDAEFSGGILNLKGATISGGFISIENSRFSTTNIYASKVRIQNSGSIHFTECTFGAEKSSLTVIESETRNISKGSGELMHLPTFGDLPKCDFSALLIGSDSTLSYKGSKFRSYKMDFTEAHLNGGKLSLECSTIEDKAILDFRQANLEKGVLELRGAKFTGGHINVTRARKVGAVQVVPPGTANSYRVSYARWFFKKTYFGEGLKIVPDLQKQSDDEISKVGPYFTNMDYLFEEAEGDKEVLKSLREASKDQRRRPHTIDMGASAVDFDKVHERAREDWKSMNN